MVRKMVRKTARRTSRLLFSLALGLGVGLWLMPAVLVPGGAGESGAARAASIDTAAPYALLLDTATNTELLAIDPARRIPTASMSKMMTLYMVFEALADGRIGLDDTITVSRNASATGGSRMFIEPLSQVTVEDLIRGVAVQSGNDASVALAEGLMGSEETFAKAITERAKQLGMTGSTFVNATGLPDPDHYSTPRDLALLAVRLVEDFPQYYHYFGELEFTHNNITQSNRNPLLFENLGADGIKTGHTSEAGYALTATAVRDGRRLVLVIGGLDSTLARSQEARRLIRWGQQEFAIYEPIPSGMMLGSQSVYLGEAQDVPIITAAPIITTIRLGDQDAYEYVVIAPNYLPAPIKQGQEIGRLEMRRDGALIASVPVIAGQAVPRSGVLRRLSQRAQALLRHLVVH
ncbi:MAG: D-alanyl-D-alanine carboxypeptidase family protein [Pseudomonadota bacterium]